MKATSMYIFMQGIRFFGHHGVMPQETVIGANFTIDLQLKTDFSNAAQTDELTNTVSYADVYEVIKTEMKIPSKLLEHVCERIAQSLFHHFSSIDEINIRLSKENPPIGSDCKNIGVAANYKR